jgi:prolyl 4-hydroxylase
MAGSVTSKKFLKPKPVGAAATASDPTRFRLEIIIPLVILVLAVLVGFYINNNGGLIFGKAPSVNSPPDNVEIVGSDGVVIPKGANAEGKPRPATKDCVDRYPDCAGFLRNGECTKNPGWMIINCPRSCNDITDACRKRDPKLRCNRKALNITTTPAYQPGDMTSMFESLQERFGKRYPIEILSTKPYVVIFDNFVADDEGEALIKSINKWERSTDSGIMNEFGEAGRILSQGRTSSNGWCTADCEQHPKVRRLLRRIEEVTGVPYRNYESFQVLNYDVGQFYRTHHDYGKDDVKLACGPRILTFFLYLSDVEEGGETAFPTLGLKVKPKKGRALLWPSTLDHDPEAQDVRTMHEALPVIKGKKYAANSWIHLYDYMKPNLWGCTGSFDEL